MKKIIALAFLTIILLSPFLVTPAFAADNVQKQLLPTSPLYFLVKVKESIQQFLTFNPSSKAYLLENFAEQRIKEIEYASFSDDHNALGLSLDRYQAQKDQALQYAENANDSWVVDEIKENTLEQQQEMTKVQMEVVGSPGVQERIVEVQKEVAKELKQTVEVTQGNEQAAEVENKTNYIWLDPNADASGKLPPLPDEINKWEYAPGTEGRDKTGRVVEFTVIPETKEVRTGDETEKLQIIWAPGTEGIGEGEVKYEGGPKVVVQEKTQVQQAPEIKLDNPQIEIKEP